MKTAIVYISGQITGLTEIEYKQNFAIAESMIACKYLHTVNPIRIKPFLGIKSWICYMINDIRELRKCTHIALMSNWKESKGACIEYFFGKFIFKLQIIWL